MSTQLIFRDIASLELELGLPKGFYESLLKEDDWSFVIKLNALFEAACTHALVARLDAPQLTSQFARLELADGSRGKIKFLSSLGCIIDEQAAFLRKLAELRNKLAHDVAQVNFTFEGYVQGLEPTALKSLVRVFGHSCNDPVPFGEEKIPLAKFAVENTKLVIWLTAAEVLACLYLEHTFAASRLSARDLSAYQEASASPVVR